MNTDHWLPSKHGEDEAVAVMDVTEAVGTQAQGQYVADRKAEGEKAYAEIERAYDQAAARSRLNYLNEQRERLKQCLYDDDFQHVAEQIKKEALSLHMVPFSKL
jgi:mevalonate pyrophosphate decarboxylase